MDKMRHDNDPKAEDDAIYALLGRAATSLSYLEFAVSELLQALLDPNEPIVVAIVAEEMSLAKRIQSIRKLAALRFLVEEETRGRLLDLASRVDSYRAKRNLFVHGHWKLMATPTGVKITCVDYRWDIDTRGKRSWSRLREQSWTEKELLTFIQEVRDLTQETLDERSEVSRKHCPTKPRTVPEPARGTRVRSGEG